MTQEFELLNDVETIYPRNFGWVEGRLNKEVMNRLWDYATFAEKDHSGKLAGNIYKELVLEDRDNWFFKKVLMPLINKYELDFNGPPSRHHMIQNHPYKLFGFWINYQKENEFNPLHNHSGVYSFVIWMQIPTYSKEQHNLPFVKHSNTPKASDFDFSYCDILGRLRTAAYHMNPDQKGKILIFPAELRHQVYPFYNNSGTRISISGNILLDSQKTIPKER